MERLRTYYQQGTDTGTRSVHQSISHLPPTARRPPSSSASIEEEGEGKHGSDPRPAAAMGDEKVFTVVEVPALTTPKDNKKEKMEKAGYWVPALLPSVEEVFKWAPFQLPVKWIKKKKQNKSMLLLSVQEVLEWALIAACCVAVTVAISVAIVLANIPIPCSETSKILQCPDLTPKQEDEVVSFCAGFLWFTVPQAAAATVGLVLPRHHAGSRRSLAFITLAFPAVAHYMHARTVLVFFSANPGAIVYHFLSVGGAVFFIAGDLLSFLSLLVGGPDDE